MQESNLELPVDYNLQQTTQPSVVDTRKRRGESVSIDDGDVVIQFQDLHQTAVEIRRPRDQTWTSCWELYNNQYDWSDKKNWQARVTIPKVRGVVDRATASFRRALVRMRRFYHIESETKFGIEAGYFTMNLLDYWLDQINFIEEFSTGLKAGLITSTVAFKVFPMYVQDTSPRWEKRLTTQDVYDLGIKVGEVLVPTEELIDEPRTKWKLGFKAVDPFNLWIGPQNRYRIERSVVDLADLVDIADSAGYSRDAILQLRDITNSRIEAALETSRKNQGQKPPSQFSREVELYHYWGDLYDKDGFLLERNVTYTMAGVPGGINNGSQAASSPSTVVLKKPMINPLFHGKDPYVIGTPYIVPFSTYNRGIVEDIAGIARMITELSCLIIDGAQFDALAAYEIDEDLLSNPRQSERGLYPGVTFTTKAFENTQGKPVIRPITTGKVPQLALNVLNFLDREQQLSSSVTSALRGETLGSNTLGEFQTLTAYANDALDDAARTVEETVLDEMLDKMAGTMYQFHDDYTLPRLVENFPKLTNMLADMSPEERFATMLGGFAFKARGVSVFMDKAQDLQKINSFIQLVSNIPGVLTKVNVDELLENIIIGIGWNPSKILLQGGMPGVYPVAMQGGVPTQPGGAQPGQLTPAQMMAAEQGAKLGGSRNNPMANAGMPLGTPAARSAQ